MTAGALVDLLRAAHGDADRLGAVGAWLSPGQVRALAVVGGA